MKLFIFCDMTLHSFVYLRVYRPFIGVLKGNLRRVDPLRLCPFLDHPEHGSIQLFRNIGTHIPTYRRRAQEVSIGTAVRTSLLYVHQFPSATH